MEKIEDNLSFNAIFVRFSLSFCVPAVKWDISNAVNYVSHTQPPSVRFNFIESIYIRCDTLKHTFTHAHHTLLDTQR